MSRLLMLAAAASVAMTVIASRAETVRAYERKDGTHVSGFDRNPSRTGASVPDSSSSTTDPFSTPKSSIDYNAIYSARDAQENAGQSTGSGGQTPVIVTTTERPSTKTAYTIISNQWVSDTLNVYGTLSGTNVIQSIVGFDKNQLIVTESNDYSIESGGTFHARLSDPKKEIRFLKVVVTGRVIEAPQQVSAPAPIAAVHTDVSGGLFVGVLVIGVAVGLIWFVVTSASKVAPARAVSLLPPTPSESANQELALRDLTQGTPPHRYHLDGFLTKKGESVIWAFLGVKHYQKGTHSEWVGRSGGASVRVFKGLWVRSGASRGHKISHTEMDFQGEGTLVLTTIGLCFIGANSTRIPLSHILAFQSYSDGIGFDTDYARNNRHVFTQIHFGNVAFIATVLDTIRAA